MITQDEVFKIGRFIKPHGVKGEIAFAFDNDVFDRVNCPYLICLIDGIFVPFFIEEYRFKGKETALITFEDVDSEEKARRFNGIEVYFPRKYFEENDEKVNYSWNYFIGFSIEDQTYGNVGIIEAVDESTINTLFLAIKNGEEFLIPAVEDFILDIDDRNKILKTHLPEGLI